MKTLYYISKKNKNDKEGQAAKARLPKLMKPSAYRSDGRGRKELAMPKFIHVNKTILYPQLIEMPCDLFIGVSQIDEIKNEDGKCTITISGVDDLAYVCDDRNVYDAEEVLSDRKSVV